MSANIADSGLFTAQICYNSVKSLAGYTNAKRLSVYLAMPMGEVQTDAIVRDAFSNGRLGRNIRLQEY